MLTVLKWNTIPTLTALGQKTNFSVFLTIFLFVAEGHILFYFMLLFWALPPGKAQLDVSATGVQKYLKAFWTWWPLFLLSLFNFIFCVCCCDSNGKTKQMKAMLKDKHIEATAVQLLVNQAASWWSSWGFVRERQGWDLGPIKNRFINSSHLPWIKGEDDDSGYHEVESVSFFKFQSCSPVVNSNHANNELQLCDSFLQYKRCGENVAQSLTWQLRKKRSFLSLWRACEFNWL